MITDIETFFDEQELAVAKYINENFVMVSAEELGLDYRAGGIVFVNDEAIAVSVKYVMSLDYYGGFEYINSSSRKESCGFVFYLREDARVNDCINHWKVEKMVDSEYDFA